METPKKSRRKQPTLTPPEDVTDEALAEWNRIITEITAMGRELKPADRALLTTYVRNWVMAKAAFQELATNGATVQWTNGTVSPSPHYKIAKETTTALRGLLNDLGCTPNARGFDAVKDDKPKTPGELVI